jgi:hypothetical protein
MEELKLVIANQKEQAQEDIMCILDGIDDQQIIDNVCQVIVDRMDIILNKVKELSDKK